MFIGSSVKCVPLSHRHWRQMKVESTGATSRLQDFDFETFREFFRLRDQKTSGAMAPVAPPSLASLPIEVCSDK